MRNLETVRVLVVQRIACNSVEDGLVISAMSQAIGAAKKLVAHFQHSVLATSELRKYQEVMSTTPKKFQQHCSTCWNSTLYMIQNLLYNRWPLTALLADESVTRRQHRYLELSSQYWLILEDC